MYRSKVPRRSGKPARRSSRQHWLRFLWIACALTPARGALAQQPDPARGALAQQQEEDIANAAQQLFREGRQAIERGDYATGCPKFADSLKLVKRASTLLNLAQCEEVEGHLRSALEHWKQGADLLEVKDERLPIARDKIVTLQQRLPWLTLVATRKLPAGSEILLDGAVFDPAKLGVPAPLDPGRHTATVRAPGRSDVELTLDLVNGQHKKVALTSGAPLNSATTASTAAAAPAPRSTGTGKRTAGFVLGGLGIAGFAAAGVTGAMLMSRNGDIEQECPNKRCTAEGRTLIDGAEPFLIGNAVAWAVGIAGLGAGAWLVLTSSPDAQTTVSASALPNGGWLSVRRSF